MPDQISTLTLGVDSTPVERAEDQLDRMAAAGVRAERSADQLATSFKSVGGAVAEQARAQAQAQASQSALLSSAAAGLRQAQQASTSAAQAFQSSVSGVGAATKQTADAMQQLSRAQLDLQSTSAAVATAAVRVTAAQEAYNRALSVGPQRLQDMAAASARLLAAQAGLAQTTARQEQSQVAVAAATTRYVASMGAAAQQTKLTANQAQQLGFQLNDLFVQIASGQSPLTALIQQGSQLSGTFGGIGGAIKGVAKLITPTVALFGAAAAAVTAVTLGYKQGAAESDAYARALILSGNAAGTTTGQLNELAKAQAAFAGTQGKAAEVLTQLAASGQVAGAELKKAAAAAIALERAAGPAADATAKKFIELGKDPLKALIRLNEAENFLTKSVYETVKALEKQGKSAEAATVAQNAYAEAILGRAGQLATRLGYIESAWLAVQDAAGRAWNAMLNIGREDTLEEQLKKTNAQITAQQQNLAVLANLRPTSQTRYLGGGSSDNFASLEGQRGAINRSLLNQVEGAAAARANAIAIKKQIEADSKPKGGGGQSPYAGLISDLRKLQQTQEEELATGGQISDARKLQISLIDQLSDKAEKLTFAQRQQVAGEIQVRVATQERIDFQRQELKAAQEIATARAAARQNEQQGIDAYIQREQQAAEASLSSLRDRAEGLELEERAVQVAASSNISLAEAIEQVTIARLREKQAGFNDTAEGQSQAAAIQREIELRERLLGTLATKAAREGGERSAKELQAAFERAYNEISQGLTDALIQGGKSGFDYVKGLFRNLVGRIVLEPFVKPIAGVLAGVTGGGSAFAADATVGQSAFGQAAQGATLFSAGKTIYEGFASGFASVGAQAQSLFSSTFGSGATYSANAATIEAQAGLSGYYGAGSTGAAVGANGAGAASTFGVAAQYAAGVAAGIGIGRGISGGFSAFGGSGNSAVNLGTAIGTAILPGLGSAIGGAIGGLVNRTFGRAAPQVESRFVEGSISGADFSGSTVTNILEKGGFLRSDKRSQQTEAITGDLDKALDAGARQLSELAAKYGQALGLPVEELAKISSKISVQITDDADANAKAIEAALKQYAEALLGTFAQDVEPLRNAGETVAQVIERVGGNLLQVNATLEQLGIAAIAASLDGGKAATALSALFGGASTLASAGASFVQKFTTEAERADRATAQITEALSDLGLGLPKTRDEFRALVEAQDLTTESGRQAFAALLGVSDAFDALQAAAGDSARALSDVVQERRGLEEQLLQLQGNTVELRNREREALDGTVVALGKTNREIYDQIVALEDQAAALEKQTEAAQEAARAAEDIAARQRAIASGVDAVIEDFLSGRDLANFFASRIDEILDAGGVEGPTVEEILGSTRDDVVRLWGDVDDAGKEAILNAYRTWQQLDELINGTARAVAAFRSGSFADQIEQARLASLDPTARIARLRSTEATLFGQLDTTSDPVGVAERLTGVITTRLAEEARLQTEVGDSTLDSLRKQLDAAKALRDVAAGLPQFVASLKFGDLSPLSARQQVDEARRLFESTLVRAQGGDETAASLLQTNAQAFLQEAASAFGSDGRFAAAFERVTGSLDAFAAQFGEQADPQIAALEAQLAADETTAENTGEMLAALLRIDESLARRSGAIVESTTIAGTDAITGTAAGDALTTTTPIVLPPVVDFSQRTDDLFRAMLDRLTNVQTNTTRLQTLVELQGSELQATREGFTALNTRAIALEGVQTSILQQITNGRQPA